MRWLVELVIGALALAGLWVTLDKAARGAGRVWAWLVRDRVAPLLEDDDLRCYPECPEDCDCSRMEPELLHEWHDHAPLGYDDEAVAGCPACEARWELPPEQSAEALGFTGPILGAGQTACRVLADMDAARERRAPWWEAEHRAAYDALGFDYPSGLMARVRELTP